jgi:hypothetical protein
MIRKKKKVECHNNVEAKLTIKGKMGILVYIVPHLLAQVLQKNYEFFNAKYLMEFYFLNRIK